MDAGNGSPNRPSTTATGSHSAILDKHQKVAPRRLLVVALLGVIIGLFFAISVYAIVTSLNRDHSIQVQVCDNEKLDRSIDVYIAKHVGINLSPPPIEGC